MLTRLSASSVLQIDEHALMYFITYYRKLLPFKRRLALLRNALTRLRQESLSLRQNIPRRTMREQTLLKEPRTLKRSLRKMRLNSRALLPSEYKRRLWR